MNLTESCFIPGTTQVVSGTADGQAILWDQKDISNISVLAEKGHWAAIKYIKLHNSAINCITSAYKRFIITGGEEGSVRIFDLKVIIY